MTDTTTSIVVSYVIRLQVDANLFCTHVFLISGQLYVGLVIMCAHVHAWR